MSNTVKLYGLFAALLAALLVSAVFVVFSKHESRKAFVELQKLLSEKDEMDVYWGRLQLEQGAWTAHGRIESLAQAKLDMNQPKQVKIIVVRP